MNPMTDLRLDPSKPLTHRYGWRNNERRAELYGRACRLIEQDANTATQEGP